MKVDRVDPMDAALQEIHAPRLTAGPHKQRLRAQLLGQGAPQSAMPRRRAWAWAACLATVLAVMALLLQWREPAGALAAAIDAVQNATTLVAEVVIADSSGDQGVNVVRWKAPNLLRIDYGDGGPYDGETWLIEEGQVTITSARAQTAVVLVNMPHLSRPILDDITRLASPDGLARLLRERGIEPRGEAVETDERIELEVPAHGYGPDKTLRLTLDKASHLPIEIHMTGIDGRVTVCRYAWNHPVDDASFSLELPEGVEEARRVDGASQAVPLPILPGEGVGAIRLGMTADDVERTLGSPDKILNGIAYQYFNHGLEVVIGERNGVWQLGCLEGQGALSPFLTFSGVTPEGIGIGSTADDVRQAYGEPSLTPGPARSRWSYRDRGIEFELEGDGAEARVALVRVTAARPTP